MLLGALVTLEGKVTLGALRSCISMRVAWLELPVPLPLLLRVSLAFDEDDACRVCERDEERFLRLDVVLGAVSTTLSASGSPCA